MAAPNATPSHSWMVLPVNLGLAIARKAVKIVRSSTRLIFVEVFIVFGFPLCPADFIRWCVDFLVVLNTRIVGKMSVKKAGNLCIKSVKNVKFL